MKYIIASLLGLIILTGAYSCKSKKSANSNEHTIFLVRHAEKGDDGTKDPPLVGAGIRRAETLADMLKYEDITKIYSTDYIRTRETAKPLALRNEIDVELYDPTDPTFARKLKNELKDHSILVVGHSNSTPSLVNSVTGSDEFEELDESNYSTYFKITAKDGKYIGEKKSF